jgi:hypothetical protein
LEPHHSMEQMQFLIEALLVSPCPIHGLADAVRLLQRLDLGYVPG